jgi:hypothetical protein
MSTNSDYTALTDRMPGVFKMKTASYQLSHSFIHTSGELRHQIP